MLLIDVASFPQSFLLVYFIIIQQYFSSHVETQTIADWAVANSCKVVLMYS